MKLLSAFGAFLIYGAWSGWVGRSEPLVLRFALIQGAYAFCSTLFLHLLVQHLYRRWQEIPAAKSVVWVMSSTCAIAIPATLHYLADNPEITWSIAPGAVASMVYAALVLRFDVRELAPEKQSSTL